MWVRQGQHKEPHLRQGRPPRISDLQVSLMFKNKAPVIYQVQDQQIYPGHPNHKINKMDKRILQILQIFHLKELIMSTTYHRFIVINQANKDFEAFSPWDDAQNINNPINTSNYNKSFVTNDGIQSDTFEMIQNRNFETLLNYEDHKKEEDFDSLDLVGKNNSPKLQDSKKVSSLPTVQEEQKEYEENQVQSAKKKKFNTKDMFTINTQYCRSEETSLLSQSNLVWFGLALTPKDQAMLQNKNFYYNRYPGLDVLARKKLFCSVTNRMRRTFENEFKFCPISFQLPEEAETLEAYMKKHPTFTFIAKPSSGKGGEGIVLVQKFSDIPNQSWNFKKNDLLVQRYIKTPLLLEGKKFDLRIYVLIKGYDPVEAYICEEGLARFCTQDYKPPTRENLKNMFIHLTNYSLNKNSENYKAPDEGFLEDDSGSKRLLSSLWKQLEEDGKDVAKIKEKIKDTVRKAVITIEPYLINFYQQQISQDHSTAKCFHLVGFDILLDTKLNAWLMEINSNPSFNMFLERDLPNGEVEKTISELDKYVKSKVVSEAIQIVSGKGQVDESEKLFEQVLPLDSMSDYYLWNKGQSLFESLIGQDALEVLASKIYKGEALSDNLEMLLSCANEHFENQ
eukprot:403333471